MSFLIFSSLLLRGCLAFFLWLLLRLKCGCLSFSYASTSPADALLWRQFADALCNLPCFALFYETGIGESLQARGFPGLELTDFRQPGGGGSSPSTLARSLRLFLFFTRLFARTWMTLTGPAWWSRSSKSVAARSRTGRGDKSSSLVAAVARYAFTLIPATPAACANTWKQITFADCVPQKSHIFVL